MRTQLVALAFLLMASVQTIFAQDKKQAVAQQVDALKKAMVDADSAQLAGLTMEALSYGHSGGTVEDKKTFIENILSGKSDFVSIDLSAQTIIVTGKTAIVRHRLDAVTNNDGKPGEVHLQVLLVWQMQHRQWKLLARQAVKAQ